MKNQDNLKPPGSRPRVIASLVVTGLVIMELALAGGADDVSLVSKLLVVVATALSVGTLVTIQLKVDAWKDQPERLRALRAGRVAAATALALLAGTVLVFFVRHQ